MLGSIPLRVSSGQNNNILMWIEKGRGREEKRINEREREKTLAVLEQAEI